MHRTRIKICGVMRGEDAASAAAAGADAIGLIFHAPAKRNISLETAAGIVSTLPPFVTPVGVFADSSVQEVLDVATALRLHTVQLNGSEAPEQVAALRPISVIKAIRVSRQNLRAELQPWREAISGKMVPNLIAFVLEPGNTGHAGGSGVANDWATIRAEIDAGAFDGLVPIIGAGGLTPANVSDVVTTIRPWAVDVSSGVEGELGKKSSQKVAAFIDAVRSADARERDPKQCD